MCIITSTPSGVVRVRAWPVAKSWVTVPAQGAVRSWLRGSIARPSPTMRWEKTGSGTCSSGRMMPSKGALSSMVGSMVATAALLWDCGQNWIINLAPMARALSMSPVAAGRMMYWRSGSMAMPWPRTKVWFNSITAS